MTKSTIINYYNIYYYLLDVRRKENSYAECWNPLSLDVDLSWTQTHVSENKTQLIRSKCVKRWIGVIYFRESWADGENVLAYKNIEKIKKWERSGCVRTPSCYWHCARFLCCILTFCFTLIIVVGTGIGNPGSDPRWSRLCFNTNSFTLTPFREK